jgi:hypothetical protein
MSSRRICCAERISPPHPFGSAKRLAIVRYVRIVSKNGACMNSPSGSSEDPGSGVAAVREERAEQAALSALLRVARLVDEDRLTPAVIDAALAGEWRLAVILSRSE